MGRTISSYRIASEMEIRKWRSFRAVLGKKEKKTFDEMLSIPIFYNVAGTTACRPILSHVTIMSILSGHYKQLTKQATEKINNQR